MAVALARDPFTQGFPPTRSATSFFIRGACPSNGTGLQPAAIPLSPAGSLESSRPGPPCSYHPYLADHFSQTHWRLAQSFADPRLSLPLLAAYSESGSLSPACPPSPALV